MTVSVRTILTWMKTVIAPIARPNYPSEKDRFNQIHTPEKDNPSCSECGCATIRSWQDMTFVVGDKENRTTEPLIHASVTMNVPVFRCTNQRCGGGFYGAEVEDMISPIKKILTQYAKPKE